MNNPVRIAEELAMLDQLSHGRLVVLFLRGTPNEFLTYGTNPDETRARTQEASVLITRALTEPQPFGWEGRFYRFQTVSVWPGPIQRPHPPLYYSGNSLESATFAAAHHLGLGISFYPPPLVAQLMGYYRQECAKHGWEPSPDQLLYRAFIAVGEDDKEATDLKAKYFTGAAHGQFFRGRGAAVLPPQAPVPAVGGADANGKDPGLVKDRIGLALGTLHFCGSPETVVQQLTAFHEMTGAGVFDLAFDGAGLTPRETLKSIRLFGTEVLPRIRHIGAHPSRSPERAAPTRSGRRETMSTATQRAKGAVATFTEHAIQVDRVRIRYREAGQGKPVVVLPAAGLTSSPLNDLLAQQFRVIVLEIPDSGRSLGNEQTQSLRELARTLAAAIAALGLEHYGLVSTALRAPLALWQAIDRPEHVDALVLISPVAFWSDSKTALSGCARDPALEGRLGNIQAATLVLLGTKDEVLPSETGPRYVERIPHCYYALVYDAGHEIESERPEALFTAVREFLEQRESFVVSRKNTVINP
jgi:alkanesulfonate monooxygenase SsuD/methylene tetrahydromethanopterin reductase-like flavin-dependent oxidoreductase (luciferase family)/pimeloyl-ACP methyl ester carboxylesterase